MEKKQLDLISVIVPVYNLEDKVYRCLNSLMEQTYTNVEIIVIDDGSTDGTGQICKGLMERDKRISYIFQENQGVSVARNRGLDSCKGEYILFVDGDDFVEKEHIQKLHEAAIDNGADISICSFILESKSTKKNASKKERIYSNIECMRELISYDGFGGYTWNKLYSRECIGSIRFSSDLCVAEDLEFNLKVFMNVKKAYETKSDTYHYVINESSVTNSLNSDVKKAMIKLDSYLEAGIRCKRICVDRGYNKEIIELLEDKNLCIMTEILHFKIKHDIDMENKNDFRKIKKVHYNSMNRLGVSPKLRFLVLLIKLIPSYNVFKIIFK